MVIVKNKIILLPGNKNKVILIIKYKYFFSVMYCLRFHFIIMTTAMKRQGRHTHTHTHTPVSYTHLDVYKRQIENTLVKKTLQVNYPIPLADLHQQK